MEDYRLDVVLGQGPPRAPCARRASRWSGATTRFGLLTPPLRARFGVVDRLDFYGADDLARIVNRSARLLDVPIDADGASRGRAAARRASPTGCSAGYATLRRCAATAASIATSPSEALARLEVDDFGLDDMDRQILRRLAENFEGRPVGLGTLADSVGEAADTLEEVYEPYLLQQGLLKRTPRGRWRRRGPTATWVSSLLPTWGSPGCSDPGGRVHSAG